ncbi:P-loop containing nucleoside triphosphate hydrolase [Trinorchestia longiramus]|nr:P-loop containing nucleoside triphosphate hydrolase [Trinorchestia longiramus]
MRHEATAKCLVGRCPAPTEELMQKLCLSATNRVLKTIKLPLVWIKNIVEDPKENVKFIHLVRDPRASFQSARKLGYLTAPEATRCLLIEQDLNASAILERRHPDKLIRITYEHLCLQPWDVSRELYHFIKNGNRAVCTAFVARKSEESLAFILKRNCSRKEPEVGPSPTQKSETTQRQTSNPSQFGTSLRNLIHTSQRIVAQVRQINVDSYQAPLSSEKPINDSYQAVPTLLNIKPYVDTPARKVFQRNCSNEHSSHQDLKQTGLYIKSKQFLNENFNSNNNNRYIFPREMSNRLELPSFIEDHLMVHLHPNILTSSRGDPHSTIRDYKSIYKVWRRTLTIHDLQTTQEACHGVITKLNHAFFTNLADLRNASIDYVLGQWRPRTLQDSCQI